MSYELREIPEDVLNQIYNEINELTPDDKGSIQIGAYFLTFEGFTESCWQHVCERGLLQESLNQELLQDFGRHAEEHGFTRNISGLQWEGDKIAYAIFC